MEQIQNNLLFNFKVDKAANSIFVNREFAAELSLVWDAFTNQKFLTNGEHLNPGQHKQFL
jgi:hypothetical protein